MKGISRKAHTNLLQMRWLIGDRDIVSYISPIIDTVLILASMFHVT